jgi:hypothetical protein
MLGSLKGRWVCAAIFPEECRHSKNEASCSWSHVCWFLCNVLRWISDGCENLSASAHVARTHGVGDIWSAMLLVRVNDHVPSWLMIERNTGTRTEMLECSTGQ